MKIQEYRKPLPDYAGFQWNGESTEEVRDAIEILEDFLGVRVRRDFEVNKNQLDIFSRALGDRLNSAKPGDHILIGHDGNVQVISSSKKQRIFTYEDLYLEYD